MADLKGKRVLVTGGAGFIGSHIIDLLVEEGCTEIVALDNLVRGRPENLEEAMIRGPVRLVDGDIRDANLMASLVKAADIVFHQAALRITHCAAEPRLPGPNRGPFAEWQVAGADRQRPRDQRQARYQLPRWG